MAMVVVGILLVVVMDQVVVVVVVISVLHISVLVKKEINEQNYSHF